MDASVHHELVQGEPRYFSAHGIEAGKHDSLRGVVDDDFDSGGGFEGTDVAAFATDDSAFDLIVVDMEHCYRVFHGGFRSHALDALDHDALGLLVGGHLGLVHNVVDITGGGCLGLVLETFHQLLACFICG